jgi:hypothetical protein
MRRPETHDADQKLQGAERRAWVRYPRRLLTLWGLFGLRPENAWMAEVRDVSQTGLGLAINRPFPPAAVLTVRLLTSGHKYSRAMLVRVKHCAPQPDGGWLIGCTFVVKLEEAELRGLIA